MTEPTTPPTAPAAGVPDDPPVELQAPDITPFRDGGSGVDYVHVFETGRPGPVVMVQALTHGNEICGALALVWLFAQIRQQGWHPQAGTLILAFGNVEAFARFDPQRPWTSRCVDEDFNRVWGPGLDTGDSVERRRARALRPFVERADRLLDLHSMQQPCRPLMVCGTADKNARYALELGVPADLLLDTGHPSGLRMVEHGGFGDPEAPQRALLIECGQHWERAAEAVAIDTLVRFLRLTGAAAPRWAQGALLPLPAQQRVVRVTEAVVGRSDDFHFLVPIDGLGVVPTAGTPIARDGEQVWTAPYDDCVLVMPSPRPAKPGETRVRLGRFVRF